jgi:sulfotransferase
MQNNRKLICVAGLPRSGSTLLCQLLAQHPQINSSGRSSPLPGLLNDIRHRISDSEFFLSQLDIDFEQSYEQLKNAYKGFIDGWFSNSKESVIVDKNRGWLQMVETLEVLHPNYLVLVCVRDLGQIFGSIEAQHDKTRLIDFPDHLDAHNPFVRADRLFGRSGIVGQPLSAIEYVKQITSKSIQDKILYVPFEYLMNNFQEGLEEIYRRSGVENFKVDPDCLSVTSHESDSYYRFKYRHNTHSKVVLPREHQILPGITQSLKNRFKWYYKTFYPDSLIDDKS